MKRTNLLRNITLGMVLSGFACSSCTDFDELNTDPTRMEKVNPGTLLDPILYDMGTYNWNRYYDYTFPLMQCLVSNNGTSGVGNAAFVFHSGHLVHSQRNAEEV